MVGPTDEVPLESTDLIFRTTRAAASGSESSPSDADRDAEPPPELIGSYRIVRKLGQGGMGDVFLAYDEALSRNIALKRIRPDRADRDAFRKRFEIEARVTGILQHPSIVPVYQFFSRGDETFYTMRPIEGITLGELSRRLRAKQPGVRAEWPATRLVRLFLQAANAVAFAHSRGVIHRDLKPDNIMIGPFEEVLVLDWGMAKVLRDEPEETRPPPLEPLNELTSNTGSNFLIGTPAYMAPEQLRQEPATFSCDIFALGVILYELLALSSPWKVATLRDLSAAVKTPPEMPTRRQPGRNIPAELGRIVLRALEYEPARRFQTVASFSKAVASALEGRASWHLAPETKNTSVWRFAGGRLREEDDGAILVRSRGAGSLFRYFCVRRFSDNVRVEFDFQLRRGSSELAVWLNTAQPRDETARAGYSLAVVPGKRRTLSLLRSGRVVAGAKSPGYESRRWYRCAVAREDDRFSLRVDDEEIYVYHDPIPLTGGFVGLTGHSEGLRLRDLRISTRGTSARISCLSVPDAFFNRQLYEEARAEYDRIADSHPGRKEGQLAAFRAGLCLLELAKEEADVEMHGLLLSEAHQAFSGFSAANDSCLSALGRAMVAAVRESWTEKYENLAKALREYPADAYRATVHEWLLGSLHAVGSNRRQAAAWLLPLAIEHCMEDFWGRRVVRDLVKEVSKEWEIPSFMTSRGLFKENDPVSHAEARLFFAFWTARAEIIEETLIQLVSARLHRRHHLADAVFALLELGHHHGASALLDQLENALREPRSSAVASLCRTAVLAATGDLEASKSRLAAIEPDAGDRIYNGARLWLARGFSDAGELLQAIKILRPLGPHDGFAREHQTWFYLHLGDVRRADKQLKAFLGRNDHRSGKNLSNFLHGVSLILRGQEEEAMRVFRYLDEVSWPRTWTLGSHYALGRLGAGDLEGYFEGAFPWERSNLRRHASLLARARGESPESMPAALRES